MPEIVRSRDVVVFARGDSFTVNVDDALVQGGWQGGSGAQYTTPTGDELLVTRSDGLYAGFLLWGSDETSDALTAMTRNQPTYRYAVIGAGGWLVATTSFEQYTYASRVGMGPLVPLNYQPSDRLVFSLRGFWTKEDEWTLSGDPRAPNNYFIGFVVQSPTPARNGYLTIQISV